MPYRKPVESNSISPLDKAKFAYFRIAHDILTRNKMDEIYRTDQSGTLYNFLVAQLALYICSSNEYQLEISWIYKLLHYFGKKHEPSNQEIKQAIEEQLKLLKLEIRSFFIGNKYDLDLQRIQRLLSQKRAKIVINTYGFEETMVKKTTDQALQLFGNQ